MFYNLFQTEDRTYSFRRRTMEATIDSTTKKPPVTPAAEGKLKCETLLLFFFIVNNHAMSFQSMAIPLCEMRRLLMYH